MSHDGAGFRRNMTVRGALLFLLLWLAAGPALVQAHDVSRSQSRLEVVGAEIHGSITLDLSEFPNVDVNHDSVISYEELEPAIERIYAALKGHFFVGDPGLPLRTSVEHYELVEDHLLRLDVRYVFERPPTRVMVRSTFHEITRPDHRHLISVRFGDDLQESVLGAGHDSAVFDRILARPYVETVKRFVTLGVAHIFGGYDHLAFLVCLLVATTTLGSLAKVITSFTLAHSITLALATFDLVILPTRLTESLIALSIAYVAIENLLQFRAVERYRITFLFGLVHGFGFASVLREIGLPDKGLLLSLVSFNVGVEMGQLAVVASVLPVLALIARGGVPWSGAAWWPSPARGGAWAERGAELAVIVLPFAAGTYALLSRFGAAPLQLGAVVFGGAPLMFVLGRRWGYDAVVRIGGSAVIAALACFWFVERVLGREFLRGMLG